MVSPAHTCSTFQQTLCQCRCIQIGNASSFISFYYRIDPPIFTMDWLYKLTTQFVPSAASFFGNDSYTHTHIRFE